jgi:hypothetical protein
MVLANPAFPAYSCNNALLHYTRSAAHHEKRVREKLTDSIK